MTAVVLAEPLTPEWHEARRHGIGASEIAAVLGISPWESPFSLYWRKVNGWQVESSDEMRTGTILEPAIANWAADQIDPNENVIVAAYGLVAHPNRPWQLATPDRVVGWRNNCGPCDLGLPFPCSCDQLHPNSPLLAVLECKWTGAWHGWGDDGTDQIPVHYRAQVQWQCDVLDVADWYLAVLGPSGFRLYRGRRDERDLSVMREHGRRFVARLEAGNPPPIDDHQATLAVVRQLHPVLVDETAEVAPSVAAGYLRAAAMKRKAEALKDRYEALLRAEMGDARRATVDGRHVVTRIVTDVAESTRTVAAHRRDYLLPTRSTK